MFVDSKPGPVSAGLNSAPVRLMSSLTLLAGKEGMSTHSGAVKSLANMYTLGIVGMRNSRRFHVIVIVSLLEGHGAFESVHRRMLVPRRSPDTRVVGLVASTKTTFALSSLDHVPLPVVAVRACRL